MPAASGSDFVGGLGRCLEIVPLLDHFDAQCSHGGILLDAVANRNHDSGGNPKLAGGEANRLTVIAPRGGDYSGRLRSIPTKVVEVDETAAHLKCTGRSVILVLHPHRGANSCLEQRPPILWGRRHRAVDQLRRRLEIDQ